MEPEDKFLFYLLLGLIAVGIGHIFAPRMKAHGLAQDSLSARLAIIFGLAGIGLFLIFAAPKTPMIFIFKRITLIAVVGCEAFMTVVLIGRIGRGG